MLRPVEAGLNRIQAMLRLAGDFGLLRRISVPG